MRQMMLTVAVLCALTLTSAAQQQQPRFDVASVKASKAGLPGPIWGGNGPQSPGRFVVDGVTVANLIRNAYDLRPEEMIGSPGWLDIERFEISATYPPESTTEQENGMLRSLLQDRFALKAHREQRELAKFHLVLANAQGRLGPQLKKSTAPGRMMKSGGGELVMRKATIRQLAGYLENFADGRVEDRTGLTGEYDLTLTYSRSSNDVERPSIFTAIQEQLGLKLERTRGLVDVLVIDSVEHPTPN